MAFVAFILGALTALTGVVGVIAPGALRTVALALRGPIGLTLATTFRITLGAGMFVAAPTSRTPMAFRALGVAIFAIGLLTPMIGVERFDGLLEWWAALEPRTVRGWSACAAAIGAAIAYGIIPRDAR